MENIKFKLTREAEIWLEKNRLMIKDCTLRISWTKEAITITVLREDKVFLICNELPIDNMERAVDIPGITIPVKFDK